MFVSTLNLLMLRFQPRCKKELENNDMFDVVIIGAGPTRQVCQPYAHHVQT